MIRCPRCGSPLDWPGFPMSERQRKIFFTIHERGKIKNYWDLAFLTKMRENAARLQVVRLRRLMKKHCPEWTIVSRPIRIVKLTPISRPKYTAQAHFNE